MGILEKISEIEKEIARTQKNKATEYHLGLLKAKLAKYRAQLLEPSKSASSKGEGFDVMKSGDARVALIGFPSVAAAWNAVLWSCDHQQPPFPSTPTVVARPPRLLLQPTVLW
uniref:Developmentally regulated GTP binding protein 2 n=1 Tax=Myotis myotis TaxID=51298 RepID=A0A7J7RDF4_MYOMY|nr:developmentally regulated GTP binding protein 2 [Myotis myotis]